MTPLQTDLLALLSATRATERDVFAGLDPALRDALGPDGGWSPKDVLAHLSAWRAIEARRLEAMRRAEADDPSDPARDAETDAANATLHAERADWTWEAVSRDADSSVESLVSAIGASTSDALCECETTVASIGVNGANHALGHLGEVAILAAAQDRFDAFLAEVEAILGRGHLLPRDSGLLLYNIACDRALSGELAEARRLLRVAFRRRPDLMEWATTDPDLAALREELASLASAG